MSPLNIEVFKPDARVNEGWIRVGEVQPHDSPGSMSDNQPDGTRDIYMFKCEPDDSKSTISKANFGADIEQGRIREIIDTGFVLVKELTKGESFEITVKTDVSSTSRRVRFTQK